MEISQADVKVLSTLFGEEVVQKISGALLQDEGELSLGLNLNGKKLIDPEEIDKRVNIGKDSGVEIGYKNVAKALGIELEDGEKDPSIISKKYKSKIEKELEEKYKNPEPSEELERAMKKALDAENALEMLQKKSKETEDKIVEWEQKYNSKIDEIRSEKRRNKITSSLPSKISIKREDALLIAENNLEFDQDEDGNEVIRDKSTGKQILNAASQPETLENVLKVMAEDRGWIASNPPDGGDGGGNNGKRKISGLTPDQAYNKIKSEGVDPMSEDGLIKMKEYTS